MDEIYEWLAERGLIGRTEREVALALEQEMRVRGADGPSFSSIVAAAENGALPHAVPRDVAIPPDTLVTLDIGARIDGYCSDCTRTWATGELDGRPVRALRRPCCTRRRRRSRRSGRVPRGARSTRSRAT